MAASVEVEQPHPPIVASTSGINFEELFNMELFGPSSSTPQSQLSPLSRGSSQSPGNSLLALPAPTPDPSFDPTFFNFDLSADTNILQSVSPSESPASSVPFDFFGSFSGGGSSPETPPSSVSFSPKNVFAIDPSLVGGPSQSPELQQHRGEPEVIDDESDDEPDEQLVEPVKVGGRGKAARKGTVASGGVVKRTSAVKDKTANDDDWRPSPEEYKKMSSKEKRQLRNKISARNFRVRRKEYISTLEGDIAERDRLIDAIREELGSTKIENVALRQEVDALKRAMLEGRSSAALPPPAPLTPTNATTTRRSNRNSSPLAKPNTHKDLPPTSPRVSSARAFWGGSLGGAGGITSVHATLIPDITPKENINPALNLPCFGGVGTTTPNPKFPITSTPFHQPHLGSNFDAFADINPFTLKTLDAYRMQLWGRMAREAGASQKGTSRPASPSGLAAAMKPAYFTSPPRDYNYKYPSPTLSALLSGKSASSSSSSSLYPTPPVTPPMHSRATSSDLSQPQAAVLATIASQTLLSKLGSAFWDAFAGRASKGDLDHDKVRKVLEGKAVVRIVDVEGEGGLEEAMAGLTINSGNRVAGDEGKEDVGRGIGLFKRTRAAVVGKK